MARVDGYLCWFSGSLRQHSTTDLVIAGLLFRSRRNRRSDVGVGLGLSLPC